jgi:hypothetical protein
LSVRLDGGAGEMDRLGRVARSLQVLPCLFTQRVTDALNARLEGYISRLAIRPITDPDEARAACHSPSSTLTSTCNGSPHPAPSAAAARPAKPRTGNPCAPPSRPPVTRQVLRGAVFLYKDLHERAIPVEVVLPEEFLQRASTNPADISARRSR